VTYKRQKYGFLAERILTPVELESCCFLQGRTVAEGGVGKFEHLRRFAAHIMPGIDWNPWLERQLRSLCDTAYARQDGNTISRFVAWTGCGTAGKTFAAGLFAWLWWIVDMPNSIVILTSTTKDLIRQRVWPVVMDSYHATRGIQKGHLLPSSTVIQCEKGNYERSIIAMAVAHGETVKAVDRLNGVHAPRILLVIDEATSTPEAIYETIANRRLACEDFTLLTLSNPNTHLDPAGMICEPLDGWSSVGIDSEEWQTKPVGMWSIDSGVCLRFDGYRSPNVLAGKTLWPYLYSCADYKRDEEIPEESRGKNYWRQSRGWWAPEGTKNTIFSEALIENRDGFGTFGFYSKGIPVAGLDPGFGGDKCALQFGVVGNMQDGTMCLQLTECVDIGLSVDRKVEIDAEIARRVIQECQNRYVRPEHLALDRTAGGRGVHAILDRDWSPRVVGIEFGASASDEPVSTADPRPGREVYANRVTELWFLARDMLDGGQLKGITRQQAIGFCSREYEVIAGRNQYRLFEKRKCRERIGRSPDQEDAATLCCWVARKLGVVPKGRGQLVRRKLSAWRQKILLANAGPGYDSPETVHPY